MATPADLLILTEKLAELETKLAAIIDKTQAITILKGKKSSSIPKNDYDLYAEKTDARKRIKASNPELDAKGIRQTIKAEFDALSIDEKKAYGIELVNLRAEQEKMKAASKASEPAAVEAVEEITDLASYGSEVTAAAVAPKPAPPAVEAALVHAAPAPAPKKSAPKGRRPTNV